MTHTHTVSLVFVYAFIWSACWNCKAIHLENKCCNLRWHINTVLKHATHTEKRAFNTRQEIQQSGEEIKHFQCLRLIHLSLNLNLSILYSTSLKQRYIVALSSEMIEATYNMNYRLWHAAETKGWSSLFVIFLTAKFRLSFL